MNLRRGFFRLWLLLSALFVIATAVVSFPDVKSEFKNAALEAFIIWDVPVVCSDARGRIGDDYDEHEYLGKNYCWYAPKKFKVLYPESEYKDLTDEQLSDRLYEKAGYPVTHASPWTLVLKVVSIAIGVPLIVLAVGSALGWSIAGFSSERKHTRLT
jgi:hypothetical protein